MESINMAIKAIQLYNPDFFSQLGSEYICTGFMFDSDAQMESLDYQLTKQGLFMAGAVATGKHGEKIVEEEIGPGASLPGAPSMGAGAGKAGTGY